MKISVIIPAYNEGANLAALIGRIRTCVEKRGFQNDAEWILVDNGSSDNTWELLQTHAVHLSYIKPVQVVINQGYGYGILEGLKQATGELLAWTHADCQTDPDDIFRALEVYEGKKLQDSPIVVKGCRRGRPLLEKFLSWGMQTMAYFILRVPMREVNAQPKLFSRALYQEMKDPPFDFSLDLYLLYMAQEKGCRIHDIPVYFKPRIKGESKGGGGGFKNRLKLIRRTFQYTFQLRRRIRDRRIGCA